MVRLPCLTACRDKHGAAEGAFMTHRKNADSAVEAADGYVYAPCTAGCRLVRTLCLKPVRCS